MDINDLIKRQYEEVDREYDKFNAFLDVGGFEFEWRMFGFKERIDRICRFCGNRKKLRELMTPTKGMSIEQAIDYCERAIG